MLDVKISIMICIQKRPETKLSPKKSAPLLDNLDLPLKLEVINQEVSMWVWSDNNSTNKSVLVAEPVKGLAGLTYVFAKGRFDRVRDQLTPRNFFQKGTN